eukprot:1926977-Amphidinium_carterae.1
METFAFRSGALGGGGFGPFGLPLTTAAEGVCVDRSGGGGFGPLFGICTTFGGGGGGQYSGPVPLSDSAFGGGGG